MLLFLSKDTATSSSFFVLYNPLHLFTQFCFNKILLNRIGAYGLLLFFLHQYQYWVSHNIVKISVNFITQIQLAPCVCVFVFPVSQATFDQSSSFSQWEMLHTKNAKYTVTSHQDFWCECEKETEQTNERRRRRKKKKKNTHQRPIKMQWNHKNCTHYYQRKQRVMSYFSLAIFSYRK